ncbi:MAG: hypothetical protein DYG89_08210, partial [Caldilinea sp. CFX5]|nr:hypothetical protein [Caldilinea sp. CFX5]
MSQLPHRRRWLLAVVILMGALLLGRTVMPQIASASPPDPITAAWTQARAAGSYHFDADVTQLTVPVAKVTNVGRTSRSEALHLAGQTNLRAQTLQMHLWSDGGSVLQTEGGVAVKIENGKTFTRRGAGRSASSAEPWQEAEGFADAFAPQGDFLAYLQAVRDVQTHEPEQRAGISFTRYSFTIDGPTFAAYVRDQMAAAMRAKGELPPGVNLDTPAYYQEMTGDGELWVGSNGLPLRQILNLDFPEQRNQTVHAQIVVDFSHFGKPQWSTAELLRQGDLHGLLDSLPGALPDLTPLGLLLPMLAGALLLVRYRRSRTVYTGLVTAIILSMVVGPLLTTLKLDAFFAAQSAKAAAQEEKQATVDAAQAAVDLGRPQFNPNVNPLETTSDATRNTQHATRNPESLNLAIAQSPALQATDPGTDTDADGLTNFAEVRVGTDPEAADSDQDLIPDNLEVRGFTFGGQTWYADPMAVDSNNDGLGDSQEWGFNANGSLRTTPFDTDSDGRPDLFDPDNDNDGVPDRQDLSPFSRVGGTTFNETNPLQLTLTNLEANKPTFVEFQLRPTDASHLWYAFNVLDWPRNDNQGQVQDVDGGTYADLAATQGRTPNVNEPFGDLKLVPMLEIRLPTSGANLPPQSDLTPYNISVNNFTADGSQKVVYVPLNIVKDEQSGQRVAFTGRMRYLPTGAWPSPHTVRLVWMVQMLSDLPCDPQAPTAVADGCQADGYIHNAGQVVQSYYEDWTLVGLNVNAQYGAKTALVYEDPAVDNRLKDDEALRALAYGLDSAFLRGRDQDGNSIRDVDVAEIARRFDRTRNSGVPSAQTWGIAGARNILRVETHGYDTFEQATMFTAMTETVSLLNRQFNSAWTADNSLKPTILYAYEQQSRDVGLDSLLANDGYVAVNGNNLTVNMQPTGQSRVALNTMTGVKWTHYCRGGSSATWTVCDSVAYWDELSARYGALGRLPDDPNDPKVTAGRLFILLLNNLARMQGATRIVQFDSTIAAGGPTAPETDAELATNIQGALALDAFASLYLESKALLQDANDFGDLTKFANVSLTEQIELRRVNLSEFRLSASLSAVKLTLVAAATTLAIYVAATGGDQSLAVSVLAVQSTMNLLDSVVSIIEGINALRAANQAGSSLLRLSAVDASGAKDSFIGAAIAILVVWGFFLYTVIDNDVAPFSPEFNRALAETIAATLYILLLTVLSLSVVGLILVAIISIIDVILTLVCELGGADNLKNVSGQGGGCFTIGGAATKVIASLLYNYDLMINTSRTDLVAPGAPTTTLANPSKGFVTGNPLTITVPITTHAVHKNPDPSAGIMINFYLYYFSRDNLRSTTFNYSLTQPNAQDVGASRGTMSGAWQNVGEDHKYIATPMYGGYARSVPAVSGVNLQPGINRSAAFYLNMGYALPAYECWYIPLYPFSLAPVCYTRTFGGKSSTLIDTLRYDILPSSISGFMALSDKPGGGVGLSWDAGFEAARDADGDGLVSARFGGLDPNDATANSDNDGLADAFELERRAAGLPYSPIQCDTDNDGLTDGQEAQFGSNPSIADSDNDGLRDSEEVWYQVYNTSTCQPTANWSGGWNVTINAATPFTIRVTSDPFNPDPDADGISDLAEKQLALNSDPTKRVDKNNVPYNPNVFNVSPITVLVDVDDQDRFVGPQQSLIYTTTAIASVAVAPGVLDISAPVEVGGSPAPMFLNFDPSSFNNAQTVVNQTSFTVQNAPNRRQLNFTSTVRARLAPTAVTPRTWDTITYQSLAAPTQPTRFVGATAFAPFRQDSYQIVTLNSSSTSRGGTGDIRTTQLPNGQLQNIFTGASTMGNTPPDIACNDNGVCMIAWDQGSGTANSVNVQIMNADGSLQCCSPFSFGVNTFRPVIATDGANFVVAYVRVGTFTDIVTAQFDSQGRRITTAGGSREISGLVTSSSDIALDLVWNSGFYYLAWKYTKAGLPSNEIRSGVLSRNGAIPTQFNLETSQADATANGAPVLAHNPANGYTLLLYQGANTAQVRRIVLSGNNPPAPVIADGLLDNGLVFSVGKLSAAVDPRTNEWLISADRLLQVYDPPFTKKQLPDLVFAANDPNFAGGNTLGLACPARASLPVTDLRFEEFPGATNFGGATCTGAQCPVAGLPGATDNLGNAVGAPASDYSVRFDGADDKLTLGNPLGNVFSLAFWYKASGGNGSAFSIESGQPNGFGLFIYNGLNIVEFFAGGTRIATPVVGLADVELEPLAVCVLHLGAHTIGLICA